MKDAEQVDRVTKEHANVVAYRRALILLCEAGHLDPARARQAVRIARRASRPREPEVGE